MRSGTDVMTVYETKLLLDRDGIEVDEGLKKAIVGFR